MSIIRIKVNKDLPGHPKGSVVEVAADDHGVPLEMFWRRRMKDSEHDNCCEVIKPTKSSKAAKAAEKEDRDGSAG